MTYFSVTRGPLSKFVFPFWETVWPLDIKACSEHLSDTLTLLFLWSIQPFRCNSYDACDYKVSTSRISLLWEENEEEPRWSICHQTRHNACTWWDLVIQEIQVWPTLTNCLSHTLLDIRKHRKYFTHQATQQPANLSVISHLHCYATFLMGLLASEVKTIQKKKWRQV